MSGDEVASEKSTDGAEQSTEVTESSAPEPTSQSQALRRQQLFVGIGIAVLAGLSISVAAFQEYPGFPYVVYLVAGVVTTSLLFGLVFFGIFRDGVPDSE